MAHSVDKQSNEATAQVGQEALASIHYDATGTKELMDRLGTSLRPDLLVRALTHRSFAHDNPGIPNNERLEFLGDAVLEMVVTRVLFTRFPTSTEGRLTDIRKNSVSEKPLADIARRLGLGSYILVGTSERKTGVENRPTVLSDSLEALFGAIYLQHGMEVADTVISRLMSPVIDEVSQRGPSMDWKTAMTKLAHQKGVEFPTYRMEVDADLTHPTFTAHLLMATAPGKDPQEIASATGSSKKQSQMAAAKKAYRTLTGQPDAE